MNSYICAARGSKDINEIAFFLTQAYVFSLELGDNIASKSISKELKKMKRI
jgi:hypothetical protein|tara:strand:+ start:145 stop:297 length:153 start_codon:yes stop_codon:yes gene_type:complete